jgi:hypothetical protein
MSNYMQDGKGRLLNSDRQVVRRRVLRPGDVVTKPGRVIQVGEHGEEVPVPQVTKSQPWSGCEPKHL